MSCRELNGVLHFILESIQTAIAESDERNPDRGDADDKEQETGGPPCSGPKPRPHRLEQESVRRKCGFEHEMGQHAAHYGAQREYRESDSLLKRGEVALPVV